MCKIPDFDENSVHLKFERPFLLLPGAGARLHLVSLLAQKKKTAIVTGILKDLFQKCHKTFLPPL